MVIRSKLEFKMIQDLIKIFESCGFKDATKLSELSPEDLEAKTTVLCWNRLMDNSKGSKKDSYIVYTVQDYQDNYFGDGVIVVCDMGCTIDLFSVYPDTSRKSYHLRSLLESKFVDPWKIEFNLHEYDNQTKLHHYSYTVSNIYGSE